MNYLISAGIGLVSGILGALITAYYQNKFHLKQTKIDLITSILGFRHQLTENYNGSQDEIVSALNQVLVVFHKSKNVINALEKYKSDTKPDSFISLIKRMFDDVNIDHEYNDSLIDRPFASKNYLSL